MQKFSELNEVLGPAKKRKKYAFKILFCKIEQISSESNHLLILQKDSIVKIKIFMD